MASLSSILRSYRTTFAVGATVAAVAAAIAAPSASAADTKAAAPINTYRVTITNVMKGQPLSPPVLVTNYGSGEIFKPGRKANWGVQQIAENGNSDALFAGLLKDKQNGYATDVQRAGAPLVPTGSPAAAQFKSSVTILIKARQGQTISWISMLGCTNDGFAGFNAALLPRGKGRTVNVPVFDYDAGTEINTEDFRDLTGGCQAAIGVKSRFGAVGTNQTDWRLAENDVIRRHEGVFEASDDGLLESVHGWNPRKIAKVSITRID